MEGFMKYLIFILCIWSVIVIAQEPLKLEVVFPRAIYSIGEPIDIGLVLNNNTGNNLPNDTDISVIFKLKDENGSYLPYTGPSGISLAPSIKENCRVINLNYLYGKLVSVSTMVKYIPEGTYTLHIYFKTSTGAESDTKVNFTVKYPEGAEKQVYEEFFQFLKELPTGKYSHDTAVSTLEAMLKKYPNSVYTPLMIIVLDAWYSSLVNDHEKAHKLMYELVNNYPWSSYSLGALKIILNEMKTKSERVDFLNKIELKSKNSPMKNYIKMKLNSELNK
jgi:hypothetical protein